MTNIQNRSTNRRVAFALRRPDLLLRKLRGLSPIEILPKEAARYLPEAPTVLEAGALNGLDTVELATLWPDGVVHTFEPIPEAFNEVEQNTRHLPNVRRYQLALSDTSGLQSMHVSSHASGAYRPDSSSLRVPSEHLTLVPEVRFDQAIDVDTFTIDTWSDHYHVAKIDFMWLDLQGVELEVLKASPRILSTTSVVCMEVSRRPLYDGCALYAEVLQWMREQGFRVVLDRVSLNFGNVLFVRDAR